MIHPAPYRRPVLTCDPSPPVTGPGAALACHKGDASQAQTSTQTGAQTGGAAISGGSGNQGNGAGNQIVIQASAPTVTPPASNNRRVETPPAIPKPAGSGVGNVVATINNGISGQDIVNFFSGLIGPALPPTVQNATPAPAPMPQDATTTTTPAPAISQNVIVGGLLGILALILGLGYFLRKKS